MLNEREVIIHLSDVQFRAWESTARYLDAEGAIRSGKTWMGATKLATLCATHPGIHCLASRWSETDLDAQLKPLWRDLARSYGLELRWHPDEQYDEVVQTGARVYLRGLKGSEGTSRYAKFRGLTLSHIWVDQAEEIPQDVYQELKGRLSQPGFPHQLMTTPNPPSEGHWLAAEFPIANTRADYEYVRFTLRDNAHHLGMDTVEAIEAAYPPGTSQHRRLIEGRRGLAAHGDPVYAGYFDRAHHVKAVEMDPQVPLLEGWDWGHRFPAVTWSQRLPWGETRILGGVMGQSMFLQDFAAVALRYRAEWFQNPLEIRTTGDPAGEQASGQGLPQRAMDVLRELGVPVQPCLGGNTLERRNYAIQRMADAMRRRTSQGEAFTVNPRFALLTQHGGVKQTEVIVDGLEAGYVWDERMFNATTSPSTRRPLKDGFYDHTQNTLEYMELAFGQAMPTVATVRKDTRKALALAQRDHDPYDRLRVSARGARRGGL